MSEERIASIIRVKRISELGTLSATSIVLPKRQFSQDPHCVTSQKTAFFLVTAAKTTNLMQQSYALAQLTGTVFSVRYEPQILYSFTD
jgi:hypothetical protein